MQVLKNKILVKLIGTEEYSCGGIIIPMRKKNTSIQVEIIEVPNNQEYYHDLELSENEEVNKRKFIFKKGDICLLSYANSANAFRRYDKDDNDLGYFMIVDPNWILAKYKI